MQLIPHIQLYDHAANRLGILRKKRDKEILRVTKKYPDLKKSCEEVATREFVCPNDYEDATHEGQILWPLDALCAEIHAEELSAIRRL